VRRCKTPGARHGPQPSWEEQQQVEKNEQQMRGTEAKLKQEGIRLRSERPACPRREPPSSKPRDWLRCPQAEEVSESIWHPEELDSDLPLGWRTRIASQALCPREPKVRPLGPRKDQRRRRGAALAGLVLCEPHLDVLVTHKLHTGASMLSAAPVTPEEGSRANNERVEQHTHLARFASGFAIPLTLLAQRTGAATVDAGRIHHAQASIAFLAPLVRTKRLPSRIAQRPIRLEGKVATREASLFPGQGHIWRSISWYGRGGVDSLLLRQRTSRSKLRGAQWIRMKPMSQFQPEVPHPLIDDLPRLLPGPRVAQRDESKQTMLRESASQALSVVLLVCSRLHGNPAPL